MDLENKEEMTVEEASAQTVEEKVEAPAEDTAEDRPARGQRRGRGKKQKIETTEEKPQSEWVERVVQISRVTKVVKGGKKLSFRAIVIVGNKKDRLALDVLKLLKLLSLSKKRLLTEEKILSMCLSLKLLFLTRLQVVQEQVRLCLNRLLKVQVLSLAVRFV